MKTSRLLLAGAVLVSLVSAGLADDLVPPNWRGQAGTTVVQWEFLTDNPTPAPDWVENPYGDPNITVTPGPGAGWFESLGDYDPQGPGGQGWWNLSGEFHAYVPNGGHGPAKEIWIQLVWSPQAAADNRPRVSVTDPDGTTPELTTPLVEELLYVENEGLTNEIKVFHSVYHFDLLPCPDWEIIHVRGGVNVDEVVIDTWCTPEPASMGLFGLGGVAALIRRRRR